MRPRRSILLLLLPLAFLLAGAQSADQYARQWSITLSRPDAGAYRVHLNAEVYAAADWRDLRDVQVIDADGKPVASTTQAADEPGSGALRTLALRWFALPAVAAAESNDLTVLVDRSSDGSVVSIRTPAAASAQAEASSQAWLIDRGPDGGTLRSLTVDWRDTGAALDRYYRLEGSDDLRNWTLLDPQVHLLQLRNQGQQLRKDTVAVATALRYLRLLPLQAGDGLEPLGFRAEVSAPAPATAWEWVDARITGTLDEGYLYSLRGRFPIQRLDVVMPVNSSARWRVSSRDPKGDRESPPSWQLQAAFLNAWNLEEDGKQLRSSPWPLGLATSDRQWRLQQDSGAPPASAPGLRLGYRSGSVVFLAQGRAPYRLVAGNADAASNQAALEPMLADLRASHGAQWQPAPAQLGPGSPLAGAAAYRPAPAPRDWKTFLLWGVLVLGALLVGGLALGLLRSKSSADG